MDVCRAVFKADPFGRTPLMVAAAARNLRCCEALLEAGACVSDEDNEASCRHFSVKRCNLNQANKVNSWGHTAELRLKFSEDGIYGQGKSAATLAKEQGLDHLAAKLCEMK